ncbi:MFS general substrate transporter [Zopfia rhizophila CBS 207.26]|uniref:MFS general substrate transporter n=1 Tax=Zopfia rhizophila CBS 207.26 TaxID=1314779 RepID=A0A6A6D924_9PEZI|nr:MFS general substrate transporter [Zopfia rhizophila CBS 207.26]
MALNFLSIPCTSCKSPPPVPTGPPGLPGGPPPDGGLKAWLQGVLDTFGVYQTYYESGDLFEALSSEISWIGSIQAFYLLIVGFITRPLFDKGHLRLLLVVGSFGVVFDHIILSLCHIFRQALLAQGFVIGLGAGCLFVPAVAILPTYFHTKLGLVIGLAASGSFMGGVIYPIMFYKLIGEVGFEWGVRILGFTALAILVVPVVARELFDLTAFSDGYFMLFTFSTFIRFIGLYVAIFYISYFGQAAGITDASLSFYLVPILNAGLVFGRTLLNWLSDKTGPFNLIMPGAFMCGILLLCMLSVHTVGGMVVVTLLFGFFSGIFIALPPVCFVALTKDKSKVGTRIGMGFAMLAPAVFCGGPATGAILSRDPANYNWTGVWIYGGVVSLVSGCIFVLLRVMRAGWKVKVKA